MDRIRRQSVLCVERRLMCAKGHAESLADSLAECLIDQPSLDVKHPDVRIKVGERIFNSHKLVLQIASGHFRELLESNNNNKLDDAVELGIAEVSPSLFEYVIRFCYRGTVELDTLVVCDVMIVADALGMPGLRQLCVDYMLMSVGPDNCFRYWRHLETIDWSVESERKLVDRCRDVARTTFWRSATSLCPLAGATDTIVESLLRDSGLQVNTEQQVCHVLLRWLDSRVGKPTYTADPSTSLSSSAADTAPSPSPAVIDPVRFLRCIRWSGVRVDYVRSTVLEHHVVRQSPTAVGFMARVVRFLSTGIQFDGLETAHRPSTKLERCVVAVVGAGPSLSAAAVSTQYTGSVEPALGGGSVLPFESVDEACSAVVGGRALYLIGAGECNTEIWRFDVLAGWRRWSRSGLCFGRRRHCAAAVDDQVIYVVGGFCPADRSLIGCLERLDTGSMVNRCALVDKPEAEMPFPVVSAACAAYDGKVYVFGGTDGQKQPINRVQLFDVHYSTWTTLNVQLPVHVGRLNAAVFDSSILVLGADLSLVFKPETGEWRGGICRHETREDVAHDDDDDDFGDGTTSSTPVSGGGTDSSDFGLVVDDGRIYVLGGRRFVEESSSSGGGRTWRSTDEVRSIPVKMLLGGAAPKPGQWSAHARLPRRSLVTVCGLLSVPSP